MTTIETTNAIDMADKKLTTSKQKVMPPWLNFVIGGSSGMMSTCVVHPMDLLKTRMQLLGPESKNTSLAQVVQGIKKEQGLGGFYKGLTASLFRQATYTTIRLGSFNGIFNWYRDNYGVPSFFIKVIIGMAAGGVGAFFGTPADVCLIRMSADGRLPPDKRRNYTHVFNALSRISREEGFGALFRGVEATITRAIVLNGSQLGTYAQVREMLLPSMGDRLPLHVASSLSAALVCSVASLPMDTIKTRVQNSLKKTTQVEVFMSVVKNEGVLALWKGLIPTFARIGPNTILCFIFLEQLNKLYYSLS